MSFIIPRSLGKSRKVGDDLNSYPNEQVRNQEVLRTLKELPKSRYATQLAVTQIPAGRGRKAVFSHIEIYKMVETIANELRETGVRPGTVCAMVTPNSVEAVVYFMALQWIGAIAAPVSSSSDKENMKRILRAVQAYTVVSPLVDDEERDSNSQFLQIKEVCQELGIIHWQIYRTTNKGVQLEQNGLRAGKDAAWKGGAADFKLDPSEISVHLLQPADNEAKESVEHHPQVVTLSHANLASAARSFVREYDLSAERNTAVMTTSLDSIHGIVPFIATLYSGGHIVIPGPGQALSAPDFCSLVKENKVTWFSSDAIFVEEFYKEVHSNPNSIDGVSLAFVRCHEGSLSPDSKEAFDRTCNTTILHSYGTTETGGMISTCKPKDKSVDGSFGKAIEGVELAIFHPSTREIQPLGSSGDIGVLSETNSPGYLNCDNETDESRVTVENEDGSLSTYLLTGRRGQIDADGNLVVEGNSRELRRAEVAAEEEVRSRREASEAKAERLKREEEEIRAREKEAVDKELLAQGEKEGEAKSHTEDGQSTVGTSDSSAKYASGTETDADQSSSGIAEEDSDSTTVDRSIQNMGVGFGHAPSRDGDAEAMSKILERLMMIEANQQKIVDDMKASHAAEVAELKKLLEETEKSNKISQANSEVPMPSVIQVNMDEVNAAVNAATQAAQDSSRHTAEAAEAAKKAAKLAEEAARQRAVEPPQNPNSSQLEIKDPANVQKTVTVSLDEIEQAMSTHSAVSICRAFGRYEMTIPSRTRNVCWPDPKYGNEVFCCILPMKGARVSEPWLKLHAQSVLPAACVPKKFYYREDLKGHTERQELTNDKNLKRISHISGYSATKMVKSPAWSPEDHKRAAA